MAKKILIVDDDSSIRDYLTTLFEDNGYEARTAGSGAEALKLLEQDAPDLITLDIEMPEMTGPWFSRTVAKGGAHDRIPVIVITGHAGLQYVIPKAVASLTKPFDQAELLRIVRETIGQ
jgi:CheY-like chemotaxis protein